MTTDIPLIDGKCDQDPDHSCTDPNDVDEDGHGTHVAGTIASPINGLGMAGVAPNVTLVNDRAGQDSGFFFLWETVNALKYAGDIGTDVANMSFYTDPWQYNCPGRIPRRPGDGRADGHARRSRPSRSSSAPRRRTRSTTRSPHGVTLVAAAGNFHTNLDSPTSSTTRARTSRREPSMPAGGHGLVPRHAHRGRRRHLRQLVGPTERQGGLLELRRGSGDRRRGRRPAGEIDVAAPGGYFRDGFGTPLFRRRRRRSSARTRSRSRGQPRGERRGQADNAVRRPRLHGGEDEHRSGSVAAALPAHGLRVLPADPGHLDGLAARGGRRGPDREPVRHGDTVHGGLTMAPAPVRERLRSTATDHACPVPATVDYTIVGRPASWNATCAGTPSTTASTATAS